jgi:hypothetical protein
LPAYNRFLLNAATNQPDAAVLAAVGAVLSVEVHVPPIIAQVLMNRGNPVPTPVTGFAIIDTGATLTCVHEPVLQQLGLNPTGVVHSGTASGPVQLSQYPARLVSPDQGWTFDVIATGVDLTGQQVPINPPQPPSPLIALIGRDLLRNCVLIWNGPGGFWTLST